MKSIYKFIGLLLGLLALTAMVGCENLTQVNTSEDSLDEGRINLKYVLTSTQRGIAKNYIRNHTFGGEKGITAAIQYTQRDYIDYSAPNQFNWMPIQFNESYLPLADADYLVKNAARDKAEENQIFFKGAGLILRSFWYGFYTSAWGDIPYTDAMKAKEGIFNPKYDTQDVVFKGILSDLKEANEILSTITQAKGFTSEDLLYGGDAVKWRKFGNTLRLRFLMRLSEKATAIQGLDAKAEFATIINDQTKNPIFVSNADNAALSYLGTTPGSDGNSWPGGPLDMSNRSEFYRRKPCATFVNQLREANDPRLIAFIRPVDMQIRVQEGGNAEIKSVDGKVKRIVSTTVDPNTNLPYDTAMYVGLPPAMVNPNIWNLNRPGDYAAISALDRSIYVNEGANPSTSYFGDMYAQNANPLVKAVYASYAECCFLLGEAKLRGWISGNAIDSYIAGIEASIAQYQANKVYNTKTHAIENYDANGFIGQMRTNFNAADTNGQMLQLMTQKWISMFMTAEFWFDWRRTGMPDFGKNLISGGNGSKIPLRYAYGDDEMISNQENAMEAINRLPGKANSQWERMWLLQGSDKPYAN